MKKKLFVLCTLATININFSQEKDTQSIDHEAFEVKRFKDPKNKLKAEDLKNLSFAYSYDITISKLGLNTGGSHELTIIYQWANRKNRRFTKRKRVVPCAKF